jgi:DNA excision repair protein ERCC-2
MGGSLSEGVDYMNNLLSAVAVAGLPLSPPSVETEALKEYYSRKFGQDKGYKYAYLFPAINRVLQAAGRAIRSESDRGLIFLMDDRYAEPRYSSLLPEDFRGEKITVLKEVIDDFFLLKGLKHDFPI